MPFEIIRNDITKVEVDAIVNAANTKLKMGGGVCGAIFAAAGADALQRECDAIGWCAVGGAVITNGHHLPAKYIIHAVGPIWQGGGENEDALLRRAYKNALNLAKEYWLDSIAFPLISAGIYGYPKDLALKAATQTIQAFLAENDMTVTLVVYDKGAFEISEKLYRSVTKYIEANFDERDYPQSTRRRMFDSGPQNLQMKEILADEEVFACDEPRLSPTPIAAERKAVRNLSDITPDESFSTMLLRLIDEKGKTDTEVYKKANVDRKLFSKIRINQDYQPKKTTVFAFAMALELSLDETKDLLGKAGFALSHSYVLDIIIEFFIAEGIYNIFEINETLFAFEQPLLGM